MPATALEQPLAATQDHGSNRQLDLVHQPRVQVLVGHGCTACERDIPSPSGTLAPAAEGHATVSVTTTVAIHPRFAHTRPIVCAR